MEWFLGPVKDAVALVQRCGLNLVVYINDDQPEHAAMDAVWTDPEVVRCVNKDTAVALNLKVGSQDAHMFASIYPVLVFPTTYVISAQGQPLQVVAGVVSAQELAGKVSAAMQAAATHPQPPAATTATVPPPATQEPAPTTTSTTTTSNSAPAPAEPVQAAPPPPVPVARHASPPVGQNSSPAPTGSGPASPAPSVEGESLEERAARLREYIAQKRQARTTQEAQEEREREMRRRRDGQAVQKQQKEIEDMQKKRLAEEVKRQRMEEKAARDRIRAQIEEDRRNRMAEDEARRRAAAPRQQQQQEASSGANAQPGSRRASSSTANLQFRFSDGSVVRQQFRADQTLADVREYLLQTVPRLTRSMQLLTNFPVRTFIEDDMSSSLADLALAPSATLIVKERAVATGGGGGGGDSMGARLLVLLQFVMGWLSVLNPFYWFSSGSGSGGRPSSGTNTTRSSRKGAPHERDRPGFASVGGYDARPSGGGMSRRVGNVHRLNTDGADAADRTDTYNGNSTQQQ